MRITVSLQDELLRRARRHAVETGRSLSELVRDALVAMIERERLSGSPRRVELPTVKGRGVAPGIDIDNTASLLDNMELGTVSRLSKRRRTGTRHGAAS